eukprot:scaffold75295_cov27-Prasinocladus_malaysianus.AAC.1
MQEGGLPNGHVSSSLPNGHVDGNGICQEDKQSAERTKSMEQELIKLKEALQTAEQACASLEVEEAEKQGRHEQLVQEITALRERRSKRKEEREAKEKAIAVCFESLRMTIRATHLLLPCVTRSERKKVREEARFKAKQRSKERARRRAEHEKVLQQRDEEKKAKEASLSEAQLEMEKRHQRFTSLKAELERMTSDKHSLVMQLKQVIATTMMQKGDYEKRVKEADK